MKLVKIKMFIQKNLNVWVNQWLFYCKEYIDILDDYLLSCTSKLFQIMNEHIRVNKLTNNTVICKIQYSRTPVSNLTKIGNNEKHESQNIFEIALTEHWMHMQKVILTTIL